MNGHTTRPASVAEWPQETHKPHAPVYPSLAIATVANNAPSSRTDAERLRDAATLIAMAAAELAAVTSVTSRTDGAATLAALRQAAGDLEGYAGTLEQAA